VNVKKILSLSLGLVVLATVAVLTGTSTVGASPHINSLIASPPPPSVPVNVTNTPLPVSISGTPTVNANIGSPTVNANILGTPNVSATISGTPAVNATITNPVASPVLVSNVADSFNQELSTNLCETDIPNSPYCTSGGYLATATYGSATYGLYVVPSFTNDSRAVKEAVIEYVAGNCSANAGDDIINLYIASPGVTGISYIVPPVKTYTNSQGTMYWSFSQLTKIYVYPGSQVALVNQSAAFLGPGQSQLCNAQITGHFVTQ
jgi:hypothetical protein